MLPQPERLVRRVRVAPLDDRFEPAVQLRRPLPERGEALGQVERGR